VFLQCKFYVVISRVTSREGMKILINDEYDKNTNVTSNVIYREIFCTLWLK